jgi:hypothetical protein
MCGGRRRESEDDDEGGLHGQLPPKGNMSYGVAGSISESTAAEGVRPGSNHGLTLV